MRSVVRAPQRAAQRAEQTRRPATIREFASDQIRKENPTLRFAVFRHATVASCALHKSPTCLDGPGSSGKGRNMRSIGFLTVALAAVTIIGCDRKNANDTTNAVGTAGQSDRKVSRGDKALVYDMAIANMAEVELAKLVPERSTDSEVKKFAQLMIDDHTKSM